MMPEESRGPRATRVCGWRLDDEQALGIDIDGIIAAKIPYVMADKFKGLAPALIKAASEWAKEYDADLQKSAST